MTSKILYPGNLRTEATHIGSGTSIETDAPLDNNGKGERFSPTDLVATALASCMFTMMGIASQAHKINMDGSYAESTKVMGVNPRRIVKIELSMFIIGQESFSLKEQMILKNTAMTCPVFESLHPDLEKVITFYFNGVEED